MKYYIKEDYYFDIDNNELRIAGPANHLFLGISFPEFVKVKIDKYSVVGKQLEILMSIDISYIELSIPVVSDVRTIRSYTESVTPRPTFRELMSKKIKEISPDDISFTEKSGKKSIKFTKSYIDQRGKKRRYGSELIFSKLITVTLHDKLISISSNKKITFKIRTFSNIHITEKLQKPIFGSVNPLPEKLFSPYITDIFEEAEKNIIYLIRTKKTSSFEYGTIFPRDWIESADLGQGDLSEETVDYMYSQSLKHVSTTGEGWHEDIISEYKPKETSELIDRKMIDIEPHYIMGMEFVSKNFLTRRRNQKRMRLIANFILKNAREKDMITFKKISPDKDSYHLVGNWRDSEMAYPNQQSPVAPYDVNCVFYPVALKTIRKYRHIFKIKKNSDINELIDKWDDNKRKFRMYHTEGSLIGYCLALYGKEQIELKTPHLDESYDLFYGDPSMEEVVSFSEKLINPRFFYTPVGPLLVAARSKLFNKRNYHGKVIWPKQAAFAIAGLTRQYKRGVNEGWPKFVLNNLKKSIIITSRACFKGWTDLGTVPELYYFDEVLDKARFFTDQENYVGQMSVIQLWSSVAARRIMKDYTYVIAES